MVVLGLDALWVVTSAERNLRSARDHLQLGADALVDGALETSHANFLLASNEGRAAKSSLWHPALGVASILPWLSDDVDAIRALGAAAELAAGAGDDLVQAAQDVGWTGEGLPGAGEGGLVDPGVIEAASPGLDAAARGLDDARLGLDAVGTTSLFGPLREAVLQARGKLGGQADLVSSAVDLVRLLPPLLGSEEPRRYFLALQNLDEPRGTGGFLGFIGILDVRDGHIQLQEFADADTTDPVKPVPLPPDVRRRYAKFGADDRIWAANFSPDFPTSAGVILRLAERLGFGKLDGVIAADQVWMQYMLEAIGPIETPGWPATIDSSNVIDILSRQTFEIDNPESNLAQQAIGEAFFDALLDRSPSVSELATAISRSVEERHLQVYSTREDEQAIIGDLGVDGSVDLGANPLYVIWQDFVQSKAGFFADRSVSVTAQIRSDGSALVTTTARLRNEAPSGPPSILLGTGEDGLAVGLNQMLVNAYLPEKAEDITMVVTPEPQLWVVEREFGRPVGMGLIHALPGETSTFTITYIVPDAVTNVDGDLREYRMDFLPQPSLRPVPLHVRFELPEGTSALSTSVGLALDGSTATYEDSPTTSQTFWVRFTT